MKRNISVLYICLGNYSVMWEGFYESAKKFFFVEDNVDYFVFTDDDRLLSSQIEHVTFIKEKNYGWPGNTLYRFRFFTSISDKIKKYDYAYFFNANAYFVRPISDELIPRDGCRIIAAQHFKFKDMDPILCGYDRNPKSTASIKWGHEGKAYCQACFIGATGPEMVKMSEILSHNIATDEDNHVVAKWHDESHFNKYICDKQYTLLPVSYVYPEALHLDIPIHILMRSKENFADLTTLRYGKRRKMDVLKEKIGYQNRKIQGYYHYFKKKLGLYK